MPAQQWLDALATSARQYEPIAIGYLASMLIERGYEVKIVIRTGDALSLEEVLDGDPDMVGFSSLTCSYPLALELATMVKSVRPGIITVIGGYHATAVPGEISEETVWDYLIAKEADMALADLADYRNGKREREDIRGIVYVQGNIWVDNFSRFDPNEIPTPFRDEKMMANTKLVDLNFPPPSQQRLATLVWSRGCKHNCVWCSSSKMFPKCPGHPKQIPRDIGNIVEEIRMCQERFGTNTAFVADLSFEDLEWARKLCREVGKTGLKWYAMARLDVDPDIFRVMRDGGCTKIGFGVESLIFQRKSGATSIGKWRKLAIRTTQTFRELGLLSKYYYMLGGVGETVQNIQDEADAICEVPADIIRLSWMVPCPGTRGYREAKESRRLVSDDLRLFNTDFPIIRIEGAGPEELQRMKLDIYRRFYHPDHYAEQARKMVEAFPFLAQSYKEWNDILAGSIGQGFLK